VLLRKVTYTISGRAISKKAMTRKVLTFFLIPLGTDGMGVCSTFTTEIYEVKISIF